MIDILHLSDDPLVGRIQIPDTYHSTDIGSCDGMLLVGRIAEPSTRKGNLPSTTRTRAAGRQESARNAASYGFTRLR